MRIVAANPADLETIAPLRGALWPESNIEELKARADDLTGPTPSYLVLIAFSDDNEPIGFAEVALRTDYVNGCDGSPVAFLEGIYVDVAYRRTGIARALVDAGMRWGLVRGAVELASDALLDNHISHAFHHALGFQETERVIYFRKPIGAMA